MADKLKVFSNLTFNLTDKTFIIHEGDIGVYDYTQIKKCAIVYEDAKFTDKSEKFKHLVIINTAIIKPAYMRYVCTGIKFTMKNGDIYYAYLSKDKLSQLSSQFDKEKKEAEEIKKFCAKIITKYKDAKEE